MSPGGWVDKAMQIGRAGMFNIIRTNWENWDLKKNGNLKTNLKLRGVDQPGLLPTYHYRDDALPIWNAIEKYVAKIVNNVYGKLHYFKTDDSSCPIIGQITPKK